MTKKIISVILLLVITLTIFTACSNNNGYIGKDKAKKVALDDIGYTEARKDALSNESVKLVENASTPYYLVKFDFGLYKYTFKIGAVDGAILNRESEMNESYI